MILCKDCRHYSGDGIIEWCLRNNLGDGKHGTAWSARRDTSRCGHHGRWFEPIKFSLRAGVREMTILAWFITGFIIAGIFLVLSYLP